MGSIGFKEWAVVCEAMGRGQQSIILRKGGLAEGRGGFAFRHEAFFLFPTLFHESLEKTRVDQVVLPTAQDTIALNYFVQLEETRLVTSPKSVQALTPLHVLREEVVQERFCWGPENSLHVALVRVFVVRPAWTIPNEARYGGCRSWVDLPDAPEHKLAPVLSDSEHLKRREKFREALASPGLLDGRLDSESVRKTG